MRVMKRWLCHTCQREWVYAHEWSSEQGCPHCASHEIELVAFKPLFPGADIGTQPSDMPIPPSEKQEVIIEDKRLAIEDLNFMLLHGGKS